MKSCTICKRETDSFHRHHVLPRCRGGRLDGTIDCCGTCAHMLHMLFSNKELEEMDLDEILKTEPMQRYINWVRKRSGNYPVKMSNRVKEKTRYGGRNA